MFESETQKPRGLPAGNMGGLTILKSFSLLSPCLGNCCLAPSYTLAPWLCFESSGIQWCSVCVYRTLKLKMVPRLVSSAAAGLHFSINRQIWLGLLGGVVGPGLEPWNTISRRLGLLCWFIIWILYQKLVFRFYLNLRGLCFILFWICDAVLGESDSTFESCIWIEIEFEDELCCGGWNSILFHQLANSAQPTREILSLQAKRDIYIYICEIVYTQIIKFHKYLSIQYTCQTFSETACLFQSSICWWLSPWLQRSICSNQPDTPAASKQRLVALKQFSKTVCFPCFVTRPLV